MVASVDAKRSGGTEQAGEAAAPSGSTDDGAAPRWRAWTHGGRTPTELDAVAWAVECAERGAGEILLTSMDRDGVRTGYDLELTRAVAGRVRVPVVASGGAGKSAHLRDAFRAGRASAALVAGILHDGLTTVADLKEDLAGWGLPVRPVPTDRIPPSRSVP
jgi:cyclase